MPTDGEITFADHTGRFYARRYGMAPMVGRLLGYLTVCDPREQTIGDLADALLASRSAIAGAVNTLEALHLVQRSRAAGERMDRVRVDMSSPHATGFDISEYVEQRDLAREGLRLLEGTPPERRAILLEWEAFADFLVDQIPVMEQEWRERRAKLQAAGDLPGATRPEPKAAGVEPKAAGVEPKAAGAEPKATGAGRRAAGVGGKGTGAGGKATGTGGKAPAAGGKRGRP